MFTTAEECYKYLYDLTNLEHNLHSSQAKQHYNLDNIKYLVKMLLAKYPDMLDNKKIVHIAGTKGKGSTAFLISSILLSKYNVATFVSPHLLTPNERLLQNLSQISDEDFIEITNDLVTFLQECSVMPTTFEAFYLMFLIFAYKINADILVIETGLGGRLDATNVLDSDVAVITTMGYDHVDLLGNTIQAIATEKAAIIKGSTAVIAKQYYDIEDIFIKRANEVGAKLIFAEKQLPYKAAFFDNGYYISIDGVTLRFSCLGEHQLINLQTAMTAVKALDNSIEFNENTCLQLPPARIQIVNNNPLQIIDVSHNKESVDTLVNTLSQHFPETKFTILSGLAADKDYQYFYKKLSSIADNIIITSLSTEKVSSPQIIYDYVKDFAKCKLILDPNQAIANAFETKGPLLVTGSFYLTGPVIKYLHL